MAQRPKACQPGDSLERDEDWSFHYGWVPAFWVFPYECGFAGAAGFSAWRRGRCFAEMDLMIRRCFALGSKAILARAVASRMRAWTGGVRSASEDGRTMCFATLPLPRRILPGSGRPAPWRKNRLTQRG